MAETDRERFAPKMIDAIELFSSRGQSRLQVESQARRLRVGVKEVSAGELDAVPIALGDGAALEDPLVFQRQILLACFLAIGQMRSHGPGSLQCPPVGVVQRPHPLEGKNECPGTV